MGFWIECSSDLSQVVLGKLPDLWHEDGQRFVAKLPTINPGQTLQVAYSIGGRENLQENTILGYIWWKKNMEKPAEFPLNQAIDLFSGI